MSHHDPLSNISQPHSHDVLCGRGAGITKHEGNKRWRELIKSNRPQYTALPRNQRPIIAESIVKAVRSLDPPGRFLTKDAATQLWYDIGDERATEKTAQAMRDSKKNAKESKSRTPSPSPNNSPVASPVRPPMEPSNNNIAMVPDSVVAQAPKINIARPQIVQRDDTFAQRMEGFAFLEAPLQREPSAIFGDLMMDSTHNNKTTTKCSPNLSKPIFMRDNTFDKRLEHLDLSIHTTRNSRSDSIFSIGSMDMMGDDEWHALETSCGMPSQPQRQSSSQRTPSHRFSQHGQFYSDIHRNSEMHHRISGMSIEEDGDVLMEELVTSRPSVMYTKRSDPENHDQFHWSF